VEEIFTAEFDGAWDEGGLFLLTMHPHITGHRSRMPVLERLIKHMKTRGQCWFATHAQVAQWCRDKRVRRRDVHLSRFAGEVKTRSVEGEGIAEARFNTARCAAPSPSVLRTLTSPAQRER